VIRLRFNEAKAAQAAARLLKLRGGRMNYLKLIKLMYLADRQALLRWGRPISTDRYVSMDQGPVLSRVYDLINGAVPPDDSPWRELISAPENYAVHLLTPDLPVGELSRAEERLLEEIFQQYGHKTRWQLRDLCHQLPEWQDPDGSAIPIDYHDILAAEKTPLEAHAIEQELQALAETEKTLARAGADPALTTR
jgi:uncharacterized phage-associated protein